MMLRWLRVGAEVFNLVLSNWHHWHDDNPSHARADRDNIMIRRQIRRRAGRGIAAWALRPGTWPALVTQMSTCQWLRPRRLGIGRATARTVTADRWPGTGDGRGPAPLRQLCKLDSLDGELEVRGSVSAGPTQSLTFRVMMNSSPVTQVNFVTVPVTRLGPCHCFCARHRTAWQLMLRTR